MTGPVMRLKNIVFTYPSSPKPVLKVESLTIYPGDRILFYGPSGGGKSTLAGIFVGLVPFLSGGSIEGRFIAFGKNIGLHGPYVLYRLVGYVPQEAEGHMVMTTVASEIMAPRSAMEGLTLDLDSKGRKLADELGVERLLSRKVTTLSGGEVQKVALASALIKDPKVLVLDEPLSQQSKTGQAVIGKSITLRPDMTVLVFEHRIGELPEGFNRYIKVQNGRLHETTREDALSFENNYRHVRVGKIHTMNRDILTLRKVYYAYPNGPPVISGLSAHIRCSITKIVGENGAGKSTLARLIGGNLKPQSGTIKAPRTALLLQDTRYYFTSHTLKEDLELQCRRFGMRTQQGAAIMRKLGISDLGRDPMRISVGERVRAVIGLLLVSRPNLMVLDEPTRGLDPPAKAALADTIMKLAQGGTPVIIFTHDNFLLESIPGKVLELIDGKLKEWVFNG